MAKKEKSESDKNNHANQGNSNRTTPNHNNSAYKGKIDNRSRQLNQKKDEEDKK